MKYLLPYPPPAPKGVWDWRRRASLVGCVVWKWEKGVVLEWLVWFHGLREGGGGKGREGKGEKGFVALF